MITGLNCGEFHDAQYIRNLHYNLRVKYFGDLGPMQRNVFAKRFEELVFDQADFKDNAKACMFYFVETVLLGEDNRKAVKNDNFNII